MSRTETRGRILDAAMELIHRNGYAETSLAEIRRQAKVATSSLYHFFPSKEDLLLAVVDQYEQNLQPFIIEPAFARSDDPLERVFGLFEVYRDLLSGAGFALGCPLGNLAIEVGDSCPEARRRIARIFELWRAEVEGCLAQALPALSPAERTGLATFVLTLIEGGIVLSRTQRSLAGFDAGVTHLRAYLATLAAQPAGQAAEGSGATRRDRP